jgi:hypothetical protein
VGCAVRWVGPLETEAADCKVKAAAQQRAERLADGVASFNPVGTDNRDM